MKYIFVDESWEEDLYWQMTDKRMLNGTNKFIEDIARKPFSGMGKPEPLKFKYRGYLSRRIDREHRLIYQIDDGEIRIAKCRFHYDSF